MQKRFTPATIAKQSALAMGALVLAAGVSSAGASTSTESAAASTRFEVQQFVRVAETKGVTKNKKPRRSEKTWLNPQPEPPMGPGKVNQGNTWLNPQPEPPRPDTRTKNLR